MYGEKAAAMVQRLEQATWLPPYDDTMREVLTEIDELHGKANAWLQCVPLTRGPDPLPLRAPSRRR